jgi:hypothetical protein
MNDRNKKITYRPPVDVVIPEQLAASYGLYIWPSAPVLAWYLWLHQVNCQYVTVHVFQILLYFFIYNILFFFIAVLI